MWCKVCDREAIGKRCEICDSITEQEMPLEILWCANCKIPSIKQINTLDKNICPICQGNTTYLSADLRPVFPEERLLIEILIGKPFEFIEKTVWASTNRYYIEGEVLTIPSIKFSKANIEEIIIKLNECKANNNYETFNLQIKNFIEANQSRLSYLKNEAYSFIESVASKYFEENVVISFSGGKDSSVVADLVVRALSNPSVVHIYGDTTLEFPLTSEYVTRFRKDNPKAIFKVAKNKEQDFYQVCEDIGPPARMLRWCCSMFKTGPITRVLNNLYYDTNILTFYGVRKCESISRSKYNRIEGDSESIKIQKQTVASPIFFWKDIDIWLYILSERIDFNDAYRLGYDRVGCWCCPNNNDRAQFLSKIYMPDESKKWRDFLIDFAKKIGKLDAEVYIDSGKWKARQGGNGVSASADIKIKSSNCTTENNAIIYRLNRPMSEEFIDLFIPFGKVSKELGRKLINEIIIQDYKTNMPILSIQPFVQDGYDFSVKVKSINVKKSEELQRMVGYQIRKYNACRKCLKCESICKYGAITINSDSYIINSNKCAHCKMCVTLKYLEHGCLMGKYLAVQTKKGNENEQI